MKEALTLIMRTLPTLKEIKLTSQQFVKVASFLQTTDVGTRIEGTKVIKALIQHEVYDKPESLQNLFPFVVSNCNSDAVPELLAPSLEIVQILLALAQIQEGFLQCNGLQAISSIFTAQKPDAVAELAISVFSYVLSNILVSEEAVKATVGDIGSVFMCLKGDVLAKYLAAFTGLLQFKSLYKAVNQDDRAPLAFGACFKSSSVAARLLALKITYVLLTKSTTHKAMAAVAPSLVQILVSQQPPAITVLACYCLVSAVPDYRNLESILSADLANFFQAALGSETALTAPALRLAGAISTVLVGAKFLEANGFVGKLTVFLGSKNGTIQKIALMFYAAFSAAYPMSKEAIKVVPTFLQASEYAQLHPYPLIFLSNVVMHPEGAAQVVIAIERFAKLMLAQDDSTVRGALVVASRAASCPEALTFAKEPGPLVTLFTACEKHLDGAYFLTILEVVSAFSGTAAGKKAIVETRLPEGLQGRLETLPKRDQSRPTLMRILARCAK
jgi:hypothetical protein